MIYVFSPDGSQVQEVEDYEEAEQYAVVGSVVYDAYARRNGRNPWRLTRYVEFDRWEMPGTLQLNFRIAMEDTIDERIRAHALLIS